MLAKVNSDILYDINWVLPTSPTSWNDYTAYSGVISKPGKIKITYYIIRCSLKLKKGDTTYTVATTDSTTQYKKWDYYRSNYNIWDTISLAFGNVWFNVTDTQQVTMELYNEFKKIKIFEQKEIWLKATGILFGMLPNWEWRDGN